MLYWSHNFTSISKTYISEEFTLCLNPDFWCFLKQQSCFGEAFRKPKQKWKYPWYQQDSSEETTQVRLKLQEWTSHQTTSGHVVSKRQLSHISLRCRKTANCFHVLGCFKDVEGPPARSSINLFVFQFITSYFGRHWFASTKSGHISWHPGRGMTFQAHETVLFQKKRYFITVSGETGRGNQQPCDIIQWRLWSQTWNKTHSPKTQPFFLEKDHQKRVCPTGKTAPTTTVVFCARRPSAVAPPRLRVEAVIGSGKQKQ